VRRDQIPESGRHVALEADESVRAAVARLAKVDAVEALSATFDLTRRGRDGLRATGTVRGIVRQACVVTLEPVTGTVEEAIDVTFAPAREPVAGAKAAAQDDEEPVADSPMADDPPEPLVDGTVDLGALATEFLILGIDPYPRKPETAFEPPVVPDDSAGNPFAVLAALKNASKVKD
jgi:uncharacterized metal-binding protein YceD (DUF177 family)